MIKIENVEVVGWEHAVRGMRNPMNSWDKSDSKFGANGTSCTICPHNKNDCFNNPYSHCVNIGTNDHDLMMRLANAGADHRKFMRMITVYMDVTAPMYWWKEFDTYKVGTVRNSCSTMHKITEKEFTIEDFSYEHLDEFNFTDLKHIVYILNNMRDMYSLDSDNDKFYWWQIIQLLPSSYNQRSTVMLNYEVLANIYHSRKNHKLDEWREFCKWIETLPHSELITGGDKE